MPFAILNQSLRMFNTLSFSITKREKKTTVTIRPILSDSVLEILMLNVMVSFFATIKLPYNIFN